MKDCVFLDLHIQHIDNSYEKYKLDFIKESGEHVQFEEVINHFYFNPEFVYDKSLGDSPWFCLIEKLFSCGIIIKSVHDSIEEN